MIAGMIQRRFARVLTAYARSVVMTIKKISGLTLREQKEHHQYHRIEALPARSRQLHKSDK